MTRWPDNQLARPGGPDDPDALIPTGLRGVDAWDPARADWLRRLPGLVGDLLAEWDLTIGGRSTHGVCALVVPVRRGGHELVLKVTFPHEEAATEHLALRAWRGAGAVRLVAADPRRFAMLLERAGTQITASPAEALWAGEQIAQLYPVLHRPPPPNVPRLSARTLDWSRRLRRLDHAALPPRLVSRAVSIADQVSADPLTDGALIHGDLHYENVLESWRPDGSGWLAIDPKPMAGDPHAEIVPLLWNLLDGVSSPGAAVRERFEMLVDVAGLDERRARDWVVLMMVVNAMWTVEDAHRGAPVDDDWVTTCVTIAKSVP